MTSELKCMTSGSPSVSPLGRWSGISRQVPSIQRTKLRLLSATFLTNACSSFWASLIGGTMMTSPFCSDVFSCGREEGCGDCQQASQGWEAFNRRTALNSAT